MKIKQYLDECSRHYYQGNPLIADEVFDRLAESIGYKDIGAKQHEHLAKHYFPMYSLQKFYEGEGDKNPLLGESDVTYTPKLDGAAISILYVNGSIAQVLTRGDGVEGTDITDKFIGSTIVPQHLHHEGVVQITGEVAAVKETPNSRNYAAGALNLKDPVEFRTRAVEFFAYGIQPYVNTTYDEDIKLLKRLGFNTVTDKNIAQIYPTDGVVFRVNNNKRFTELGYTSNHPKGAYALKTRGEAVETTILDVEWGVGKSGKVTPVAILEPIYIGDKLVSRATLNNQAFIESLDIQIGSKVGVILGGEIIPCIIGKVE